MIMRTRRLAASGIHMIWRMGRVRVAALPRRSPGGGGGCTEDLVVWIHASVLEGVRRTPQLGSSVGKLPAALPLQMTSNENCCRDFPAGLPKISAGARQVCHFK